MDLKIDIEGSFSFDSHLQMPAPNSASSFSSTSSSYGGPYTPTSGRSTPHSAGFHYDMTFASEAETMLPGMTAPSFVSSSSYMHSNSPAYPTEALASHGPPLTPGPCLPDMAFMPDHLTPSSCSEIFPFSDGGLRSSPLLISTLQGQLLSGDPSWDASSKWADSMSPIEMFQGKPPAFTLPSKHLGSDSPAASFFQESPSRRAMERRRIPMKGARMRTSDLQRIQETTNPSSTRKIRTTRSSANRVKKESFISEIGTGIKVTHTTTPANRFKCDFEGCTAPLYKRMEHMKRHQRSHYGCRPIQCPHCPKQISNGRTDNYRQHLENHANPNKATPKSQYFEAAAIELAALKAEIRSRRSRGNKREE